MKIVTPKPATNPSRLALVGLRLFFDLAARWNLTVDEQLTLLGKSNRHTLRNWKAKVDAGDAFPIERDTLERLSYIAGIRKAVELLYDEPRWDSYMKAPNKAFGGSTPLEKMLRGSILDLADVRRYLDASRGAHFG